MSTAARYYRWEVHHLRRTSYRLLKSAVSCREVKAVVRPYPGAVLSQNIAFRAALAIAYSGMQLPQIKRSKIQMDKEFLRLITGI